MSSAPIQEQIVTKTGMMPQVWRSFFTKIGDLLSGRIETPVASFTVSTLPIPDKPSLVFVSNEAGGATLAFWDGTNWRRVQDRAIVA